MVRFQPREAIVVLTGATSGIGRALASLLVRRGAQVIAAGRRQGRLQELAETLADAPGQLHPVAGDITEARHRQELIERARALGEGRLDLLVNNAGIGAIGPFAQASEQRLRQVMEVNFFAPVELTRCALPALARGRAPVICNISSVLGHRAVPDKSEYCASKFALHGWSDALRSELAGEGIQVTLVSPSTTASEFFDATIETAPQRRRRSPLSWTPERVAAAALRAIRARRAEVILSLGGKSLVYADRLAPPLVNYLLARSPRQRPPSEEPG